MAGPSIFFGDLEESDKEDVLQQVARESIQKFKWYAESLEEALHIKKLTGSQLLKAYRQRLPISWAMLQDLDMSEYDRQMSEWRGMENAAIRAKRPHTPNLETHAGSSDPFVPHPQEG